MNTVNGISQRADGATAKLMLMSLCIIGLVTAIAAQQPASADDVPAAKTSPPASHAQQVSMAGLDLSTAAGMQAAHDRIQAAARKLCTQIADMNDLSRHANYLACVDESTTAALQQIRPPTMVAAK
jgi:UrcA family protein